MFLLLEWVRTPIQVLGPVHQNLAIGMNNMGMLMRTAGRFAEAEDWYHKSMWIFEKTNTPNTPTLIATGVLSLFVLN